MVYDKVLAGMPIMLFERAVDWEAWLSAHHGEPDGAWLKIAKKAGGRVSVSYEEAVEVALCYGWIDGQVKTYDERYYVQKFTPRRRRSVWSKINVARVEALMRAGKMRPSGLAAVAAAKADGRWAAAYDSPRTMKIPADFAAALKAHPKAKATWETLNKTNTYAVLWRLHEAKRPETRAARMEKFVAMLERGEKLY